MRGLAAPSARTVDLEGAAGAPGYVDTHPHLMHFGVPSRHRSSTRLPHADMVHASPPAQWIMATPVGEPHSFRDLIEGVLPGRRVLDRATREHPVMIQAWAPVIPNVCALDSARLGLGPSTPDRVGDLTRTASRPASFGAR